MSIFATALSKAVDLFDRGLLTRQELIDAAVFGLATTEPIPTAKEAMELLPPDLLADILKFLEMICDNQYEWRPFLLDRGSCDTSDLPIKLHQLHETLNSAMSRD
jgi:hypothetical protein